MTYNGFEIIDKTTGKPITVGRYHELWRKEQVKHLAPYMSWDLQGYPKYSDSPLDPDDFKLFLGCDGKLYEFIYDYEDTFIDVSDLDGHEEIEIRLL